MSRWEAAQTLARQLMLDLVGKAQKGEELPVPTAFVAALKNVLTDPALDKVSAVSTFEGVLSILLIRCKRR